MREDKLPWLWIILAGAILCAYGCGGYRPGGATAAPSPTATVEPSIVTEGDVQQTLETIQETLTEVKNLNASAQTELLGRVENIENLTQSVQTTMHDIGPEQAEIEKERMASYFKIAGVVICVFVCALLIALAAPSVGGALVTVFYLTGIGMAALPIIAVLVLTFIFKV
jgi:hypothetical protein